MQQIGRGEGGGGKATQGEGEDQEEGRQHVKTSIVNMGKKIEKVKSRKIL